MCLYSQAVTCKPNELSCVTLCTFNAEHLQARQLWAENKNRVWNFIRHLCSHAHWGPYLTSTSLILFPPSQSMTPAGSGHNKWSMVSGQVEEWEAHHQFRKQRKHQLYYYIKKTKVVVLLVSTFWWLAEKLIFFFFKNSQGPPAVEDAGFETALWNPALSSLGSQLTIPWYPFEKRTFLKENDTPIFLTAVLSSATVYPSIHWIRSEYRVERPAVDQTDALNHTRIV